MNLPDFTGVTFTPAPPSHHVRGPTIGRHRHRPNLVIPAFDLPSPSHRSRSSSRLHTKEKTRAMNDVAVPRRKHRSTTGLRQDILYASLELLADGKRVTLRSLRRLGVHGCNKTIMNMRNSMVELGELPREANSHYIHCHMPDDTSRILKSTNDKIPAVAKAKTSSLSRTAVSDYRRAQPRLWNLLKEPMTDDPETLKNVSSCSSTS